MSTGSRLGASTLRTATQDAIPWWLPAVLWAAIATTLLLVQSVASPNPGFLDGWSQFDGPEYLDIVDKGYQQRQLVWFPALPLLTSIASLVTGSTLLAAVVVSGIGGLVAAVLFGFWTRLQALTRGAQLTAVLVLLLYPYGWFQYGVVYPDALFLAFTIAAFLLLEREHPWLSALAGACATAARPSGFAVVLGLVVLNAQRSGFLVVPRSGPDWVRGLRLPLAVDLRRRSPSLLIPFLSAGGLVAYMTYQWISWGSPLRFVSEQSNYHEAGLGTLLKEEYFSAWSQGFDGRHLATTTAQGVVLLVFLASVPAVGRRFGWGYAAYVAGLVALPLVSVSTFMGVGRYVLPAFPCFALFGEWLLRRRAAAVGWFLLSAAALLVMTWGFARSWYLT